MCEQHELGHWIHMHICSPCSSGSPLLGLLKEECCPDSLSFELPKTNSIWNRETTKRLIEFASLKHHQDVFLGQCLYRGRDGKSINKVAFSNTHLAFAHSLGRRFGICTCKEHGAVNQRNWTETGFCDKTLPRAFRNGGKAAMRLGKTFD